MSSVLLDALLPVIFLFYFFSVILIVLSYKSFRGGIDYLNFFKRELAGPRSGYTPFATIFVPCRGLDQDLKANLSALFDQDYPEYEIVFIADDEKDEAVPVIKQLVSSPARPARLVIAPKTSLSSQKVENLREGVLHASAGSKVFVFTDSDARTSPGWLRSLVAPLEDKNTGAATGYRWFIAEKFSLASEMCSVWNASIATALGENTKGNFCWGGSMALRRDVFDDLDIRERWRGTLSDDFTVTRAMKDADRPIVFVPGALTASIENCTLGKLFEFTTRQMKITRVYSPHLWIASFIGSGIFNLVYLWGIWIIVSEMLYGGTIWPAIAVLILISLFSIGKSWLRLKAVGLVLTGHKKQLRLQWITQNTLWILSPAVFFYNCVAALLSRNITWRGITYELKSPSETVITARSGE
jgi:ceramide glucosyltransferase